MLPPCNFQFVRSGKRALSMLVFCFSFWKLPDWARIHYILCSARSGSSASVSSSPLHTTAVGPGRARERRGSPAGDLAPAIGVERGAATGRSKMDPAAEITQWVHSVPIPDSPCADARRLSCSPTLAGSVSKVLDDDNLLNEIIVRLDFPTTLVRAALVCKRWLCHASDPAFLRRFRKLHPPRLLGFYLDVRSLSLFFNPTRPCFMPVLPQPPELATVARRVASYSFDSDSVRIEDCQNGRILVRRCTSRFGSYGDVLYPLGPKGAVAILPCPPENPPRDTRYSSHDYVLFKQGGQDLVLLGVV